VEAPWKRRTARALQARRSCHPHERWELSGCRRRRGLFGLPTAPSPSRFLPPSSTSGGVPSRVVAIAGFAWPLPHSSLRARSSPRTVGIARLAHSKRASVIPFRCSSWCSLRLGLAARCRRSVSSRWSGSCCSRVAALSHLQRRLTLSRRRTDRNRVQSKVAGPAARTLSSSPNATNGATSATRREAGVTGFDCGAGVVPLLAPPRCREQASASTHPSGAAKRTPHHHPRWLRGSRRESSEGDGRGAAAQNLVAQPPRRRASQHPAAGSFTNGCSPNGRNRAEWNGRGNTAFLTRRSS
jgi:hypothetical protein